MELHHLVSAMGSAERGPDAIGARPMAPKIALSYR